MGAFIIISVSPMKATGTQRLTFLPQVIKVGTLKPKSSVASPLPSDGSWEGSFSDEALPGCQALH